MRKHLLMLALTFLFAGAAQATPITYTTILSGANENPPNASPGIGSAFVIIDTATDALTVSATFADLVGNTTAAHIHCCTAPPNNVGVATQTPSFVGFPLGVTSGFFLNTYDLSLVSTYNAAFVAANGGTAAGAESALALGLSNGQAYFNIHTTFRPGGEMRGFLQPVPEPASLLLLTSGLASAGVRRWRKRHSTA